MSATSHPNPGDQPALIALDWGTSSLRAYLLDAAGAVLDTRRAPLGIVHLKGAPAFEQAFADIAGGWLKGDHTLQVVAGGMVGSAQGWMEAPYVRAPADVRTLAARAVRLKSALGPEVLIAPGVIFEPPERAPDVMRGEEIQIAGALAAEPWLAGRAWLVLPGTHSKWVLVEDERIVSFATYITGELYAVLCEHSMLGRLMSTRPAVAGAAERAFEQGLAAARESGPGDLPRQLFATRALGLTKRLSAEALADYLSGVLVGHELVSGLALSRAARECGAPLVLIGDAALRLRYAHALQSLGAGASSQLENTAPRGLFELAREAGLLNSRRSARA